MRCIFHLSIINQWSVVIEARGRVIEDKRLSVLTQCVTYSQKSLLPLRCVHSTVGAIVLEIEIESQKNMMSER